MNRFEQFFQTTVPTVPLPPRVETEHFDYWTIAGAISLASVGACLIAALLIAIGMSLGHVVR